MDEERIDGYRRFINKLWNAARFAQMHIKESEPGIVGRTNPTSWPCRTAGY